MDTLLQQIINGLVLGSLYALIALGYTMVYGVLNLINFAHGDVLMIGALGAGYIGELTNGIFGSNYQDVFAFIVLCAVLILRPSGLLGERVADRA